VPGADPALALVGHRPFIEDPQQDHVAMQREQRVRVEPVDLAIGRGVAISYDRLG
jgi:hypothetical protein